MDTKSNIPRLPLNDQGVFVLSLLYSWYYAFPSELREHTRFYIGFLRQYINSPQMPDRGLVAAAYMGAAPLPTSLRRLVTHSIRINKQEPHEDSQAFRKNDLARDTAVAKQFGMSRGELKRLFKSLDSLAESCVGVSTFQQVFNCQGEILNDPSPFAPPERDTFAQGPLYLWDLAKAVNEHQLTNMRFATFDGWILFIHLEDGVVAGHTIHPVALRHGDMFQNPFRADIWSRKELGFPMHCMDVPDAVESAVKALASQCFPGSQFRLVPPPTIFAGQVMPSWGGQTAPRRPLSEG